MPQSTNGSAPPDTIPYDEAVLEGKEILKQIDDAERGLEVAERRQLRLGELADKLEPKYKDRTLAKFAKAIGVAKCTLDRYRTVYRKWEGKLAPGPISVSYAVLRELQTHDDRAQIIRENPNLTKSEAQKKMRDYRHEKRQNELLEKGTDWDAECRKWFMALADMANKAFSVADFAHQRTRPEQQDSLLKALAVDPGILETVRRGGEALVELADHLEKLLEEQQAAERAAIEPEGAAPRVSRKRRTKAEEVHAAVA